jgi:hypothetical protein
MKITWKTHHAMPLTESLSTAVLVKETQEAPGADSVAICPSAGCLVSVGESLGAGKTKPLPLAIKQIELQLRQMGESGQDLLMKHFPQE